MENINKLSLPATILIASVIFGSFYYFAQTKGDVRNQEVIATEQTTEDKVNTATQNAVNPSANQGSFYNENICADRALVYYQTQKQESARYWNSSSYISNYNSTKEKCYVAINATADLYFTYKIADAMSGVVQGFVNVGLDSSGAPDTTKIISCITSEGDCFSYQEFQSKVFNLMRE